MDFKAMDQNQMMAKNYKVPDSKSQWPLLGYKRTLLAGIAILSRQSQQRVLRLYGTGKSAEKWYNTRTVKRSTIYHNYGLIFAEETL